MKILIWDNYRGGWIKFNGGITSEYLYAESFDSIESAQITAHSYDLQSYELFALLK